MGYIQGLPRAVRTPVVVQALAEHIAVAAVEGTAAAECTAAGYFAVCFAANIQ
jgi:hypothetical protein